MSFDMLSVRLGTSVGQALEHLSRVFLRRGRVGGWDCGFRVRAGRGGVRSWLAAQGGTIRPCRGVSAVVHPPSRSDATQFGGGANQSGAGAEQPANRGCQASPGHRPGGAGFSGWGLTFEELCANAGASEREGSPC